VRNLGALKAAEPDHYRTHVGLIAVLADPRRIAEMHDFFTRDPLVCENRLIVTPVRTADADSAAFPQLSPEESAAYEEYLESLGQRFAADVLAGCDAPDHLAEALFSGIVRSIHGRGTGPLNEARLPAMLCVPGERLFLSAKGTYYTCTNLADTRPLGDAAEGFDPEKGLATLQEFQAIAEKECRHCWAVRLCPACMVRARQGDHLSRERLREWCSGFLHQLERGFRIYLAVASRDRGAWSRYYSARPDDSFAILGD
jgi:radical SAM protein with 4Fe4S-binding SPASM domain